MAVVDRRTADAVPGSILLRRYASLEIRTTRSYGNGAWTGRYVNGPRNYLELFGPGDSGDESPVGSLGVALGGDVPGVTAKINARLRRAGVQGETRTMHRTFAGRDVPWFSGVGIAHPLTPAHGPTIEAWTMEFQPEFFAAAEAQRPPSQGPRDAVSRRRYLANLYKDTPIADIRRVEIAVPEQAYHRNVRPLLRAAGFCLKETSTVASAKGGEAEVAIRFVAPGMTRLLRIDFALSRPVSGVEQERIGHSILRIGPGKTATWRFGMLP
ncbi:DUF5829 family protein [Sphingomonas sp. PL-96]|nr:DUF5829 family protein [Sphingomonas sp. PL-96]